jgi:hypothetical protein
MAIKINEKSRDFSKKELYLMTQGAEITTVKDVPDGTVIEISGFLYFDDEKEDDTAHLLSILDNDGNVFTTQSKTFKDSFESIVEIMENEPFSIKKVSGESKAGRHFVDCTLV